MIDLLKLLGDSTRNFETAVVLTYRLDLALYDGMIRRVFNRAGITNQILFCDFQSYVDELRVQRPRYIGRHYSVVPVHQQGAFHPKVYLLLGPEGGTALIGSGNTTVGGLLRNAEVFGQFEYRKERGAAPHSAFKELTDFVAQLVSGAPDSVRRQFEQAVARASWLQTPPIDDHRQVLLGAPGKPTLIDQIRQRFAEGKVDGVTVCSSSFDRRLSGLQRLAEMSHAAPVCIVQPERVNIDGQSVHALGSKVTWKAFVDPVPLEKRRRRDVFAHAKVFIFRHGESETTVFGSCNASEPALMGINTEAVVMLSGRKNGTTAEQLGLNETLNGGSAFEQLVPKRWPDSEETSEATRVVLLGISASHEGYQLSLKSPDLSDGTTLVVASEIDNAVSTPLTLSRRGEVWVSELGQAGLAPVIGWLENAGARISNPVAITWPDVAHRGRVRGLARVAQAALMNIQDGLVLGTVLFDLLNSTRDFEIRAASRHVQTLVGDAPVLDGTSEAPSSFFYTDARPAEARTDNWTGDRQDLDILASLIQPLGPAAPAPLPEEEMDEDALREESDRRQLDSRGERSASESKPEGRDEKKEDDEREEAATRRAIAKLESRLKASASALEKSLVSLGSATPVPPALVARQLWMVQVGAFLVGRQIRTKSGALFIALNPVTFARYVLRVARALVGGRRGGFLGRVMLSGVSADEEALRKGLGFLRTCVAWASKQALVDNAGTEERRDWPRDMASAVPELTAARFEAAAEGLGVSADNYDLERRFPVLFRSGNLHTYNVTETVATLTAVILAMEKNPEPLLDKSDLKWQGAGTLVFNENLGVTVLISHEPPSKFWALDFSRGDNKPVKYDGRMFPLRQSSVQRVSCRLRL